MIEDRLKFLIKHLGINQSTFADDVGISKAYVSELLNGKVQSLSLEKFKRICDVFHLNPKWLLNGIGEIFEDPDSKDNPKIIFDKYHKLVESLQKLEFQKGLTVEITIKS